MPRLLTRPGPPLDLPFEVNPTSPQAVGLVAWWSMLGPGANGTVAPNYVGSRSPQTLLNGQPYVNDRELGRALDYNGSSYASVSPVGAVPTFQETTPFSVACWFRTSTSNAGPLIANWNGGVSPGWEVDMNAGSIRLLLLNAGATAGRVTRTTSTSMAGGALTHCVCTYSGNSSSSGILIYINGFLVALTSALNTAPGTLVDNGVALGYSVVALYTGRLAGDVRIYNRVLSAAEVFQSYAPQTRWELYRLAKWRTIVRNPAVQYTISPAGTVTPAGALVNKDGKVLAGTVTPTGALAKQVAKLLSGTLTPTGALLTLKVGLVSLAGTLTPAGVLVKQAGKILTGTVTPVGTLLKLIGKVLAGTVTPAGALAVLKVGLVSMAGTVTPAGALVKRAGKVLAGAITPTGVLATKASFNRVFTGTLTPTGTLVKQLGKLLAGTLTPAGALAKQAGKALSGVLTPAGALVKQGRKILSGTLTPTGALAKQGRKTLAGAMTPSGAFGALKVTLLALAGTLAPAGTLAKFVSKVFSGAWSAAGNVLATRFAGLTVATTPPAKKVSIQTNGRADPAAVSVQTDIRRVS